MIEAFSERPVRLFFEDETRLGLKLLHPHRGGVGYRRVTARGIRPVQPYQVLYEYYWLYGAVEPRTGEAFYFEMPALDVDCFSVFLAEFAKSYAETLNVVVLDGAPAHAGHALAVPENVALVFLPPYCPELNPVERLWLALKKRLDVFCQRIRTQLEALREHVAEHVRAFTNEELRSLTGYGYIRAALELAQ